MCLYTTTCGRDTPKRPRQRRDGVHRINSKYHEHARISRVFLPVPHTVARFRVFIIILTGINTHVQDIRRVFWIFLFEGVKLLLPLLLSSSFLLLLLLPWPRAYVADIATFVRITWCDRKYHWVRRGLLNNNISKLKNQNAAECEV